MSVFVYVCMCVCVCVCVCELVICSYESYDRSRGQFHGGGLPNKKWLQDGEEHGHAVGGHEEFWRYGRFLIVSSPQENLPAWENDAGLNINGPF